MKFSRKLDLDIKPPSLDTSKTSLDTSKKKRRKSKSKKANDPPLKFKSCIQVSPYLYYFSEHDCHCGLPCAIFPCSCAACTAYGKTFVCVNCFLDERDTKEEDKK